MKGLYTNSELIDTLIHDINQSIRELVSGNPAAWCAITTGMIQKLVNLKKGVEAESKSKDKAIDDLKRQLRAHGVEIIDVGGDINGGY